MLSIASKIKSILSQYGNQLLLDGDRFVSILSDVAPSCQTDLRVLRRMKDENLLNDVYYILISKEKNTSKAKEDVKQASNRLLQELAQAGFADDWKHMAFAAFDIEWPVPTIISETSAQQTQKIPSQSQAPLFTSSKSTTDTNSANSPTHFTANLNTTTPSAWPNPKVTPSTNQNNNSNQNSHNSKSHPIIGGIAGYFISALPAMVVGFVTDNQLFVNIVLICGVILGVLIGMNLKSD